MINSYVRRSFFFFFLFISFGFSSPNNIPLKKNSILDIVLDRGVLRVGVTADYIPFVFQDSQGNYKGIDIDLANQLANDMEVSLEFVPTTRKELTRDILLGKFDVAMSGLARTMKQALITNMSTGYFECGKSLLVRASDKEKFTSLSDANDPNITIGVKTGSTSKTFVELHLKNADIKVFDGQGILETALQNGAIDAVLTDNIEAKVIADKNSRFYAVDPYHPFNTEVLAFAFAPGDSKWQQFLNLWLLHQMEVGEIERLQHKWIGD